MTYRSEAEAMRARVAELESELADARETILRLRGEAQPELPDDDIDRVTGIGRFLHHEREVPAAITDERLAVIAAMLDRRIPGGALSVLGPTLQHRWGCYAMRINRGAGRTTIELTSDYRSRRALLFRGAPGLAVITAVFGAAVTAAMTQGNRVAIALGIALGVIVSVVGLRELTRRNATKERILLTGVFEAAVDLALTCDATAARRIADTSTARLAPEPSLVTSDDGGAPADLGACAFAPRARERG